MELKFLLFSILFLAVSCGKLPKSIPSEITYVKSFSWISQPNEQQAGSFKIEFHQPPRKVSAYTLMKCCGSQKKISLTSVSETIFKSESFLRLKGDYTLYLQVDSKLNDEAITDFIVR